MDLAYIPLLIYLLAIFLVPFLIKKGANTDESYFLAGRSIGVRASFISVVATETSVATVLIFPSIGYAGGWNLIALCMGYIVGRILVAHFYLSSIYSMSDTSIYSPLGETGPGRTLLELAYLMAKYISSGVRFFMGGLALATLFGGPVALWILVTAVVAGIYSLSGGLRAVIVTDQIQGLVLFGTGLFLLVLLWPATSYFQEVAAPAVFTWTLDLYDGAHTIPLFLGGLVVSVGSHGADQDLLQRIMATKTLQSARKALILSGLGATVVIMTFVAVGAFLAVGHPDLESGRELVDFVKRESSPILAGLFAVLVAAASMSTLDSALHSTGAVWKSLLSSGKNGRWFSLLSLVMLTVAALVFIYFEKRASNLLALALGSMNYVNGALIAIFSYFVFWRRPLKTLSLATAIAVGFSTTTALTLAQVHWTFIAVASAVAALLIILVCQTYGASRTDSQEE